MQPLQTVADKLSVVKANTLRKLEDLHIGKLGTKCQILRISQTEADNWGQTVEDLKDMIIDSVFVTRPYSSSTQLFSTLNEATQDVETSAIDVWEFLPLKIKIPFFGDRESQPTELFKGDIIVEVLRDHHNTKIPVIYQITRTYGSIHVFSICAKTYDATLYRGTLSPSIQSAIDLYVKSVE